MQPKCTTDLKDEHITLKAKGLTKTYNSRPVVQNLGLEVSQGEVIGLLGPNGAGKTTSFYMIVGLVSPDDGQILFMGENVTKMPLYKRSMKGIGYLPQESSVFRDLTVEENIESGLEILGRPRKVRIETVDALIEDFGLHKVRKSYGRQLSGGERRRVEIARILAIDPKFILFDEPFAGVDPIAVLEIQELVVSLKKRNIGVLITDHNVRETLGIVDKAYIMNNGKLLVYGTPDQILESEEARKFYLGEKFKL